MPSNLLVSHYGNPPLGFDVPASPAGIKIMDKDHPYKQITITNASDEPIYLSLWSIPAGTTTAEVGKGIYLAVSGGAYEFNNINMCYNEIWATHGGAGTKRLCVQPGR